MAKVVVFVLGIGVVLAGAWYALNHTVENGGQRTSEPKRALDNVRGKAQQIEDDSARHVEDVMKRTTSE